jgi:hypothetical protein
MEEESEFEYIERVRNLCRELLHEKSGWAWVGYPLFNYRHAVLLEGAVSWEQTKKHRGDCNASMTVTHVSS